MNHFNATAPLDGTIDIREVEYYRNLANLWWDRSGPFWPLHKLNELRVQYLRTKLTTVLGIDHSSAKPFQDVQIVDIGCGGGILSESMAMLGAEVTAIDVVNKNIQVARQHCHGTGLDIDYRLSTASELRAAGDRFDVVLNMEVVEHVADLTSFMRDCCDLVRPGGVMVIATINRTLASYLFAILGAEYVLRWLPKGTHRWRQFPKPAELKSLLARDRLEVVEKIGVKVNPFTKQFSLSRSDLVNYMLIAHKGAGFVV